MTLAIASALVLVVLVRPAVFLWKVGWSAIEPPLIVLLGWLSSLPFYKIHTLNMRIPDLTLQMFSAALPCAVLGVLLSVVRRAPIQHPNIPTS
jgi:hypothetical protein